MGVQLGSANQQTSPKKNKTKPSCPQNHGQTLWRLAASSAKQALGERFEHLANLQVARTLLVAPGLTTRDKKLLGAPGIATRNKKLLGERASLSTSCTLGGPALTVATPPGCAP